MPPKTSSRSHADAAPASAPAWLKPLLLVLTTLLFLTWFTGEVSDTDIWLHLMTGRHTLDTRALTVPDPFSYNGNRISPAFPNEAKTRYFNLTSEWLAQVLMHLIFTATGFPGLVLLRAAMLIALCGLTGLMVWWRTAGGFYHSIASAIACGAVAINFQQSRPFLVTFLFMGITMALVERRRYLWTLVPLFVLWANLHGGYLMGWVILGSYCGEALIERLRKRPVAGERELWMVSLVSLAASGLNPNGYRAIQILIAYRGSTIQSLNPEWMKPAFWEPSGYSFLLFGALALMCYSWRKVRVVDWILYFVFAAASLMAVRNTLLLGIVGAVIFGTYLPEVKRTLPALAEWGGALALTAFVALGFSTGDVFQLHAAEWLLPVGAADFLQANKVTSPIFNIYETGGYLVWRLWPAQRDFIDPRGLSEEAYADYYRILNYAPSGSGGESADELLAKYHIDVLVLDAFDRFSGKVRPLAVALSDPGQTEWKLVQADTGSMVFMRHPPPGVQALPNLQALATIESTCQFQIEHAPKKPACARGIAEIYNLIGDAARARQWMAYYESRSR